MSSEDPTKRYRPVAAIVLVSEQAEQIEACKLCAEQLEVHFRHCGLQDAAETAAKWRPFALLVNESVMQSAAQRVDEVARQTRATMIVLGDSQPLPPSLMPKLKSAFDQHFA